MNNYRAEVDGLRAIAVVSVILYHAKVSVFDTSWFEGGYIGVDIFFVISGYLISKILLTEMSKNGRLDFQNFYRRRAKRILPMLFTVMLVSFPFAWFLLQPTDLIEYAQSVLAAIFFGSNFFFYGATTEYGAASSLLKPFLHTWSLGVEEQFYLLFPIVLVLIFKYARNQLMAWLVVFFVVSFQFAQTMEGRNSDLNFYLPFSRFWEMLAGSILAVVELRFGRVKHELASATLPILGLYLVAYAIATFDAETAHPGLITLLPILGVSLIIGFTDGRDLVSRILSHRFMVGIGLISYSLYLWHFPLFAFARMTNYAPSTLDKAGWIIATVLLSLGSYYLIEKPFRGSMRFKHATTVYLIGLGALLIVLNVLVVQQNGFASRYPSAEAYEQDNQALKKERTIRSNQLFKKTQGQFFDPQKANVLVVGNSHGEQLAMTISAITDVSAEFEIGWLRFYDLPSSNGYIQLACFDDNVADSSQVDDLFYASHSYQSAQLIVVATRYNVLAGRTRMQCESKVKQSVGDDVSGLSNLIRRATRDGKRIALVGNTVEFVTKGRPVSDELVAQLGVVDVQAVNRGHYDRVNVGRDSRINLQVQAIAKENKVPYWSLFETVCDDRSSSCYGLNDEGRKLFYDYGHFTLAGIDFFAERLERQGFLVWLKSAYPSDSGAQAEYSK